MLHPKIKRHGCMSKQSKANINNVTVFTFSGAILLVSMRTRDMMGNAYFLEKGYIRERSRRELRAERRREKNHTVRPRS